MQAGLNKVAVRVPLHREMPTAKCRLRLCNWPLAFREQRLPGVNGLQLALDFVPGFTVAFLQLADELVPLAADHVDVVISQFTPLLLDFALELLPVAFDH